MKILHITRQYAPSRGGIERFVQTLISNLQQKGIENRVLTLQKLWGVPGRQAAYEEVDGIPVHRVNSFGPRQYRVAPIPDALVQQCDLIHLHSSDYFFDACIRKYLGVKPILLSSYGFYFHTQRLIHLKKWVWKFHTLDQLGKISRVVCVSQQDATLLEKTRAFPNHQIIPVGVDQPDQEISRANHQWRCLSIARLDENKQLEDAIHLVATLYKEWGTDVTYTIIGRDNGQLAHLQATARSLGVEDRVTFLGEVSEEVKMNAFLEHDFLLSSSVYESFGIAIVEGMAHGLVPMCSRIPSSEELIQHGNTGFLLDYQNPEEVRNLLNHITGPEFDFAQRSQCARMAAKAYSWPSITTKYLQAYQDVLGETDDCVDPRIVLRDKAHPL